MANENRGRKARSESDGDHDPDFASIRSKKSLSGGMQTSRLYDSSIVRTAALGQRREFGRVIEHLQRRLGQAFDVEKGLDQAVLPGTDQFSHGRRIRAEHHAAAGHRVQERPREHERCRQVDVQVADSQDVGQLLGKNSTQEDESRQVVVAPVQDPFLEARRTRVKLVPSVMDFLPADDDEDDVRTRSGDPVGDLHEQVETPDRLQSAGDERHHARARRDRSLADLPRCRAGMVEIQLDPVEMDLDLGMKPWPGTRISATPSPSNRHRSRPGSPASAR